jgi:hypothetical protein
MSTFPQITTPPQASAEVLVNRMGETLEHQAVYGLKQSTTTALTWGYYGGRWGGFSITAGTLTLTDASANYVVVAIATGVISVAAASTNWDNDTDYVRVYKITAASGAVTAVEDHRAGPGGVHGGAGGGGGGSYQPLDADLTAIAGLTATSDNFIQSKSSAWASRTPAQAAVDLQGTGLDVDMAGFRGIPQNAQTGNYSTVAADAGRHLYHASGAGSGDTYTIDSAGVAYEIGTAISFVNLDSNSVSIAIATDTLYLAGTGTTGTRALAQYGVATALKIASTVWIISGTGLT